MGDFGNLTVVITGASTGLGRATAVGAAQRGARVLITYAASVREAEETAESCRALGAEATLVQGDVAEDADCRRIAEAAATLGEGRIHALVNNAGVTRFARDHGRLEDLQAEDFARIFAVNVTGAYQMTRACRPLLEAGAKAAGRASAVVNVSSIAALNGTGSSVAYAASKGALNTMTLSLARALAPSIRVNAACPGFIDTPWAVKGEGQAAADRLREIVRERTPLRQATTPEEVAETVLFLASPLSRNMTGELVRTDAGLHLL